MVVAERENNLLVGTVSCYGMSQASNWPQVGVAIYDPAKWRRGMGYEALGMWCEYLWQAFPDIVRLGLSTWLGNTGMIRLARKLGFQQEACLRKARALDGEYYDALGYGVLRDEWCQRYPRGFASDSGS